MKFKEMQDLFDIKFREIVNKSLTPLYIRNQLNQGQTFIASRTLCCDSVYTTNSVAGQATYGLSNEMVYGSIKFVAYAGDELRPVPKPETSLSQGVPREYYLLEKTLGLYPVPASAGEIKVISYEIPPAMTTDGSETPIPLEYHDLIVDYALWKAFQQVGQKEDSMIHRAALMEGIEDMIQRQSEEQMHRSYQVKSMLRRVLS